MGPCARAAGRSRHWHSEPRDRLVEAARLALGRAAERLRRRRLVTAHIREAGGAVRDDERHDERHVPRGGARSGSKPFAFFCPGLCGAHS